MAFFLRFQTDTVCLSSDLKAEAQNDPVNQILA